jgi:hypothetical protein
LLIYKKIVSKLGSPILPTVSKQALAPDGARAFFMASARLFEAPALAQVISPIVSPSRPEDFSFFALFREAILFCRIFIFSTILTHRAGY